MTMSIPSLNDTLLVVGEKFAAMANGSTVETVAQLVTWPAGRLAAARRLVVGQGVGPHGLASIRQAIARCSPGRAPVLVEHVSRRADRALVHKRCPHNVVITPPEPCAPDTFSAQLVIDDRCAELADHTTGVHVQGMVLIEAARQMFIAVSGQVCERAGYESAGAQHLLREVQASFSGFVYPLPTTVRLSIGATRHLTRAALLVAAVTVRFEQGGQVCASIRCKAVSRDGVELARLERSEADRQLRRCLRSTTPPAKPGGSATAMA